MAFCTAGNNGAYLSVQDDGNLVIYTKNGQIIWTLNTKVISETPRGKISDSILMPNANLPNGNSLQSTNKIYKLIYQTDGNLVLYKNGAPIWATNTTGKSPGKLSMQSDGNLILYDGNQNIIWKTNTGGNSESLLILQDDGNLVIYTTVDKKLIWQSNSREFLTPYPSEIMNELEKYKRGISTYL